MDISKHKVKIRGKKPKKVDLSKIDRMELNGKLYCCEDELNCYWDGVFEDAYAQAVYAIEKVIRTTLDDLRNEWKETHVK